MAQGYVRCGRCSNVFNAIVGLTDDRGALAQSGAQGTATTSIIRKAPSISDDEPGGTGRARTTPARSEAVYAEPDANEVKVPGGVRRAATAQRARRRAHQPRRPRRLPTTRAPGAVSFVAPPPGPPGRRLRRRRLRKALDVEKRYSDTEGIDTYSESELEFNPDVTDADEGVRRSRARHVQGRCHRQVPQVRDGRGAAATRRAAGGDERAPSGARPPAGTTQGRGSAAAPTAKSSAGAGAAKAAASAAGANGAASTARFKRLARKRPSVPMRQALTPLASTRAPPTQALPTAPLPA